jgi:thymidine kinase
VFDADTIDAKLFEGISAVFVDESQFLRKNQVIFLAGVVDTMDIPVLCYGLRTDFMGEPFEGSKYLLSLADNIIEIKTICECSKKATMNIRIDADGKRINEGAQVQIGREESYVSVCRADFFKGI